MLAWDVIPGGMYGLACGLRAPDGEPGGPAGCNNRLWCWLLSVGLELEGFLVGAGGFMGKAFRPAPSL